MPTDLHFNREDFPPINEEETQLILGHKFDSAVKFYKSRCKPIALVYVKQVIEFERDRLLKDRTLAPKIRELLSHNVRDKITEMADSLANQLCVTRAHILDYIVIEATKLSKPR